ncbi:histidine phosphatase family protein [Cellulomonas sp. P24]|uniref:histidine phosphatase family protein n=1 Tax=Cellulomonas sp. P24 TaxID=2885206 RepID=UPI00216AFB2A|nr:histidine phosphatase family protein [Cellulomonas sp. P24]MCR6494041.1 histidine phosphatase family protein [Cellulomonas sp. P24]
MSAGRVVLWRHARTGHNASGRLQGQIDIGLDEVGLWQARTSAEALAATFRPTAVVSSDLTRARTTAGLLAERTGHSVTTDPRLRERSFGQWEGLTGEEIAAAWPDEYDAWRRGADLVGVGAESRSDVAGRTAASIREHAAAYGPSDTLVVVSHGAAITLAVTALLDLSVEGWRGLVGLDNAHWATLRPSIPDAEPSWRLTGYNLGPRDTVEDWNAGPTH